MKAHQNMDGYRAAVTDYNDEKIMAPTTPETGMHGGEVDGDSHVLLTATSNTPTVNPIETSRTQQSTSTQSTAASDDGVEDLGTNFLNLLREVDDLDTTALNEIHGARHADGSVHYSVVFNPDRIKCPMCDMAFANEFAYREHRQLACDDSGMELY